MLSDEEKKAIEILKLYFGDNPTLNITKYVNIVLNLIEKQQVEINKEKEKNKELEKENLEIRDWKYVIDSPIDLDKLKELDLIKIKGKEYVSKDKIKAKIEELEKELKVLKEKNRQSKMRIVQLENEITARIEDVNKYFTPNDKIEAKMAEKILHQSMYGQDLFCNHF